MNIVDRLCGCRLYHDLYWTYYSSLRLLRSSWGMLDGADGCVRSRNLHKWSLFVSLLMAEIYLCSQWTSRRREGISEVKEIKNVITLRWSWRVSFSLFHAWCGNNLAKRSDLGKDLNELWCRSSQTLPCFVQQPRHLTKVRIWHYRLIFRLPLSARPICKL